MTRPESDRFDYSVVPAVFSLAYAVLLNPLPYPDAARIVEVDHAGPGVGVDRDLGITFGFYREYAARARSAEAMAMYSYPEETLTGRGDPVRLRGMAATPSLEDVLRVRPLLGRWFTAEEAEPVRRRRSCCRTGSGRSVLAATSRWWARASSSAASGVRSSALMPATFTFPAAASAIRVLRARAPVNVPRLDEVGLQPAVLVVTLFTVLAAAALLGVLPALRRRGDPAAALADGGRRSTAGRARRRGREVLMATQVALALVLLIGSGLLFRTFHHLRAVDVGFTEREALTFELGLPFARYETRAEAQAFHLRALERLRALPGVRSAGAVGRCLPLVDSMCGGETLEVEGRPVVQGQVPPVTGARVASEDYFRSIGIRVRGRSFAAADAVGAASVVVLSRATAEAYFPGEDALGKRVRFGNGPRHTVVGIANDVRGKVETNDPDEMRRLIYLPLLPEGADGPTPHQLLYTVSTAVPPLSVVPAVRAALAELDPGLPLANVRTLQQVVDAATAPTAFALTLIGLGAAIALLLGAVGVYAVIAYTVSCRTAEIGVRMALGARASDVRAMVLRQGAAVVAIGVGIGLVAAFGLTRLMVGMLYGIRATDPFSYATLTILMAAIAALALWLPARRASRVDPNVALRNG